LLKGWDYFDATWYLECQRHLQESESINPGNVLERLGLRYWFIECLERGTVIRLELVARLEV
jgi:hypothetical protein